MSRRDRRTQPRGWPLIVEIAIVVAINLQTSVAACIAVQALAAPAMAKTAAQF